MLPVVLLVCIVILVYIICKAFFVLFVFIIFYIFLVFLVYHVQYLPPFCPLPAPFLPFVPFCPTFPRFLSFRPFWGISAALLPRLRASLSPRICLPVIMLPPFPGFRVFFFVVRQWKHGTHSPGVPRPLSWVCPCSRICVPPCPLFSLFGSWTQTRPPPCPSLSVCSRSPLCCRWKLSGAFQLAALCRDPAAVCVRPSAPVPGIYPGQTKKAARRGCLSHGHIMDALAV